MSKARLIYFVALGSHVLLLSLLFVWIVFLQDKPQLPKSILLIIAVLPLALPLRGMLDSNRRSFLYASFLSLLYILHAGSELYVSTVLPWPQLIECLLALILLISSVFFIKWSAEEEQSPQP